MDATEFAGTYFELWQTADDSTRHALIQQLFTESAVHYVAPANASFTGLDEIEANIARVNKENIQQAGLQFRAGQTVANHDSVQVEWQVATPGGQTVGTGRDFILRDADGRVTALYMFIGS